MPPTSPNKGWWRTAPPRDLRLNKVPNIKPESVGRLRRPTDSGKSGLVFYFLASPQPLFGFKKLDQFLVF
jgi:hypothetical protein